MSYTKIEIEEYEVEYCENCHHYVAGHYNIPEDIFDKNGNYLYTAEGCMVITGERKLKGDNPYLRCKCLYSK